MKKICFGLLFLFAFGRLQAENGYDLWLRYKPVENKTRLQSYRESITGVSITGQSPTMQAVREELETGLRGLLNSMVPFSSAPTKQTTLLAGAAASLPAITRSLEKEIKDAGMEGYIIATRLMNGKKCILITAATETGVLYGAFHFLRLLQTEQPLQSLKIVSAPRLKLRLLNHWDNLDRTVERGYAGFSLWNWHTLPVYIDPRYKDYARANASIGINGTVLTNVNANATVLTQPYIRKVAALAAVFRPYGIKVYLTARFSAPVEIGGLKTADPLDPDVRRWWNEKAAEIYASIPDFGGFLVKANSEGQPGPQNYGRHHAEGANMLAGAVAPHGGIVMWRAFVYSSEVPDDRHKQAYNEFVPLDGKFRTNVLVQVKNGAIDFMPREPFHPLFGAIPKTQAMMEFQVTQEYLGQGTNLVYLAPLFKECLDSDTYSKGKGSTVARVLDGSLDGQALTGMAGVANIGNDINWCGHPFAQANWYALGRLSWDHQLSAEQIAEEWLRMSFSNNEHFISPASRMMKESRETTVQYSMPLGLHHLMTYGSHYGPAPWVDKGARPDWTNVYYHKADSTGLGFNRTTTGSNALGQYHPEVRKRWEDPATCESKYLLWFHHIPWAYRLASGRNLWEELCYQYYTGAAKVKEMQKTWTGLRAFVDKERFEQVKMLLQIQYEEALWWRDACLLYFQEFSRLPLPAGYEKPGRSLEEYKKLQFPYAPGN